jgi:hypothetical protein
VGALLTVRKTVTLTRAVVVVTAATLALVCAGCGSGGSGGLESRTPREIIAGAQRAFARASSLTLRGMFHRNGQTYSFDYEIGSRDSKGTVVSNSFRIKFIDVGGYLYVDVNCAYWKYKGGAALARRYGGVWLRGSATNGDFASLGSLITKKGIDKFLEILDRDQPLALTKGQATVNGQLAVMLTSKKLGITLYVAAKGTPYPLELTKSAPEKFDFGGYNHPVSVTAPAHWITAP